MFAGSVWIIPILIIMICIVSLYILGKTIQDQPMLHEIQWDILCRNCSVAPGWHKITREGYLLIQNIGTVYPWQIMERWHHSSN